MDDPYYPVGSPSANPMPTGPQVSVPDPLPQEPYGTGSEEDQSNP